MSTEQGSSESRRDDAPEPSGAPGGGSAAVATASRGSSGGHAAGVRGELPKFTVAVVTIGAAWLAFSLLHELSGIIAPMFLALNLMITAYPLHRIMVRHHIPKGISATVTGLVVLVVLFGFLAGIAWSVAATVTQMQTYGGRLTEMYHSVLELMTRYGWDEAFILDKVKGIDPQRVVSVAGSVVSDTTSAVGLVTVIVIALIFMVMDTAEFGGRMGAIGSQKPGVAAALSDFAGGIRRYWLVTTVFGLIVAALDWGVLVAIGVPLAAVWALFSFLTNYIPNIGFIVGLVPPAMLALFDKGWVSSVIVVVAYCVLNFVVQSIIQPKVAGNAVGLTPTMSFVSLLLWGWVFGGLGTLIALPCSLLVKAMLIDPDPDARWVNALISSRSFEHEDPKNEEDAGKAGDTDDARDADSAPQREPTDESEGEGSEDERRPARD
jgi:predicted PurR-regulated permease PerM